MRCHDDAVVDERSGESADALLARMRAAARLLAEGRLDVDPAPTGAAAAGAHLRRAVLWQRYGDCARDIARASLRLWSAAGGVPEAGPPRPRIGSIQFARAGLSADVRTACAALRAELCAEASRLALRDIGRFGGRVQHEVARVTAEVDRAMSDRLADCGLTVESSPGAAPISPGAAPIESVPPRRRPGLENQLTTLLGAGFGAGAALTVGRVVAELWPAWTPSAVAGCALLAVVLTAWTVLTRRLLVERAAAERWVLEVIGTLRPALEERVVTQFLTARSALANTDRRWRELPDTPD
jgi:hypothetical protein